MIRINVAQRHIDDAKSRALRQGAEAMHRRHSFRNPLALAVQEEIRDEYAAVTEQKVYTAKDGVANNGIAGLPGHARDWLRLFYSGDTPSPFCFDLAF